jgi:hypothetical protein
MRSNKLTPRKALVRLAGRRFATWNFDALRLELGIPGPDDERTLRDLPEGGRLWREPITAEDAAEYVISLWGTDISGGPYYLAGIEGQHLMDQGLDLYATLDTLEFIRFLNDVHEEGVRALDRMIASNQEFLHAMLLLSAMGAADRVWAMNQNTSFAQGLRHRKTSEITADVQEAGIWDLIEWEVDGDGWYPLFTDTWIEVAERLEVQGGALPRLPRDLWPSLEDIL